MSTSLDFATLSLMDALDLATLIEIEAYQRYEMFANQLGRGGTDNPATVFASMAENEAKHGKQLAERRKAMFGDKPARVSRGDLFDVEAPDVGAPRRGMSVLKAFEVALSSEQKAFHFYDDALEYITDPTIVELFTELRDEETEHIRMVEECIAGLPENAKVGQEIDRDESPAL